MDVVRKIIEKAENSITIELPDEYKNRKLEVTIVPLDEEPPKKKYDFSRFAGKLKWKGDAVAEQRRLRDEWD